MTGQPRTVTLSKDDADRLARLVERGGFASPDAALTAALSAPEEALDPEIEAWLTGPVAARYDRHLADPGNTVSLAEAERLLGLTP